MKLTVGELARRIDAELVGDSSVQINAVSAVETADENSITFIADNRHAAGLEKSRAGAVIVGCPIENLVKPQLVVKNVNAALIKTLSIFAPKLKGTAQGIDPTAKIGDGVRIAAGVAVGAGVVIEDSVEIGQGSVIAGGCKLGENSKLGKNCRLDGNVVIYHNCRLGNNVIIQANSTIGSTGFGYCFIDDVHQLIPHNGIVVIEDFVEIGANSCIDRAKFGETRIGAGTKIDNFVQIAHNVVIGKCCLIAAQVGIAGSCKLGDRVIMGGRAGLSDNIEVGDGAIIGGQSVAFHNVGAGKQLWGTPAIDKLEQIRIIALMRRLPKLVGQLKHLRQEDKKS